MHESHVVILQLQFAACLGTCQVDEFHDAISLKFLPQTVVAMAVACPSQGTTEPSSSWIPRLQPENCKEEPVQFTNPAWPSDITNFLTQMLGQPCCQYNAPSIGTACAGRNRASRHLSPTAKHMSGLLFTLIFYFKQVTQVGSIVLMWSRCIIFCVLTIDTGEGPKPLQKLESSHLAQSWYRYAKVKLLTVWAARYAKQPVAFATTKATLTAFHFA